MDKTTVKKDLENKTLTIERTFDAPKDKVWHAYADKDTFIQWWGPEGWETRVKEFAFQPGGRLHYGMECVDKAQGEWFGKISWGIMALETVDEPNGFSYKDYFSDETGKIDDTLPTMVTEIKLIETDGKTLLRSVSHAQSAEDIEKLLAMGMIEGMAETLDKLERVVTA